MSHPEQLAFMSAVVEASRHLVAGARVIEIGSYDVNGSMRQLFSAADEYVGVDLTEGPSVDVVGYGHEIDLPDESFDIAVSGECFEHDPHWRQTLANMIRMTRAGGLVVFTCATRGRPEHGTVRSEPSQSPGTQAVGHDYYRNLTAADVAEGVDLGADLSTFRFWTNPFSFDLYFVGIKAGASDGRLPSDDSVKQARRNSRWGETLPRTPLYVLVRVLPEAAYDTVAHYYWNRALIPYQRGMAALSRARRATQSVLTR